MSSKPLSTSVQAPWHNEAMHAQVFVSPLLDKAVLPEAVQHESLDVRWFVAERLGIDTVHEVIAVAYQQPVTESTLSCVLQFRQATREAQNALLKILEEPPATTVFFVLLPDDSILLPTVRSRVLIHTTNTETVLTSDLVPLALADRLSRIAAAAKKKDATWMNQELSALVQNSAVPSHVRLRLATHKDQTGASKKMLLEWAALSW